MLEEEIAHLKAQIACKDKNIEAFLFVNEQMRLHIAHLNSTNTIGETPVAYKNFYIGKGEIPVAVPNFLNGNTEVPIAYVIFKNGNI